MTRRLLILGLATVVLAVGGRSTRAGSVIPLPTTLDSLVNPADSSGVSTSNGNTVTVGNLEFADFTYKNQNLPPAASEIGVSQPLPSVLPSGYQGVEFTGGFAGLPNASPVDFTIEYTLKALTGSINSAFLQATGGLLTANGVWDVGETISTPTGVFKMDVSNSNSSAATVSFPDVPAGTTITIIKDIYLSGATVSVVDQAFNGAPDPLPDPVSNVVSVPEPTSMALLGIGFWGLFTFRRFLKRAFVG